MPTVHTVTPVPAYPAQEDILLKTTKVLPAAAAGNNHSTIDLGQTKGFPINGKLALKVNLPATPSLVDAKTVTLTVKDSADDSTFTAVPELATIVATGAGGAGAAAIERIFPLPPSIRRYVRVYQDVLTAGGDNTAIEVTAQLLVLL